MGDLYILALYGFPLLGIAYVLIKQLKIQLDLLKRKASVKYLRIKIALLFVGIIYSIFCFSGLALTLYRPSWFSPPNWLVYTFIIIIVPYFGCVLGFIGLGYIGHSGMSPSSVVGSSVEDIKKEYSKKA